MHQEINSPDISKVYASMTYKEVGHVTYLQKWLKFIIRTSRNFIYALRQ